MAEDINFQRPIGAEPSNEELESVIPEMQRATFDRRLEAEMKWLTASAVLDGFHYHSTDWNNRSVRVNPHQPKGTIRVQLPEMASRFRREMGRMLSYLRPVTTRPVVTGDPKVWRANRFSPVSYTHLTLPTILLV